MFRLFIAKRWKIVVRASILCAIWHLAITKSSAQPAQPAQPTSEAVSSADFLSQWNPDRVAPAPNARAFPRGPLLGTSPPSPPAEVLVQAGYSAPSAVTSDLSPAQPSPATIGSGLAKPNNLSHTPKPNVPFRDTQVVRASGSVNTPVVIPESAQSVVPPRAESWSSWWKRDPKHPDFQFEIEMLSFRRSNDSGGSVSQGDGFDRFGRELAGRLSLAKLDGQVDRTEWIFMWPMEWERSMTSIGPTSTTLGHGTLPASSLGSINNASRHDQRQSASLYSLEWNRRWTGDGLSSFLGGLRILNYDERYRLTGLQAGSTGEFLSSTDNVLVGAQMGLCLVRPLSQRLSVGASSNLGCFGNFASGSYVLSDNANTLAAQKDDAFRVAWVVQPTASLNYRMTQNSVIFCGYEAIYFSKLASVADLRLGNIAASNPFSLRARDDQLIYGWTAGLSAKF
ncbi:MAG: hypothetical protein ABL921_18480 [Pirellula sp.]